MKKFLIIVVVVVAIGGLAAGVWLLLGRGPSADAKKRAESLVAEADTLVEDSRYIDAVEKYDEARRVDSGNADAYIGIADVYHLKNRVSDAQEVLEACTKSCRDKKAAYLTLGEMMLDENDVESALEYLKKAKGKGNHEVNYMLAVAYVKNSEFDEARELLGLPADAGDVFVEAKLLEAVLLGRDIDGAKTELEAIEKVDVEDENLQDKVDAYGETLSRVEDLDEDESSNKYIDVILAHGALQVGYESVVISRLEGYTEDEGEYWELNFYLGDAYYRSGDIEKSIEHLEEAMVLNPLDYNTPWLLGRVYYEEGSENEMSDNYVRAVALSSGDDRVKVREEYVELLLETGQYSSADEQLSALVEEDPDNVDRYNLLQARAYIERNQFDDASEVLDGVDTSNLSDSDRAEFSWLKAEIYWGEGERDSAKEWVDEAIEYEGVVAKYHLLLGNILFEAGDEAGAGEALEKAVDLDLAGDVSSEAMKILDRI